MAISVNRAIKYRNLLAAAIHSSVLLTHTAVRFESIEQLEAEHKAKSEEAEQLLVLKLEDTQALYDLRLLIEQANTKGSGECLNRIAMLEDQIRVLSTAASSGGRSNTLQQLVDAFNLKVKLEKIDPVRVVGVQNAAVNLFDEARLEEIRDTISELKREIENLKERRNALNLEVQIALPDGVTAALKRHKII